MGVKKVSHLDEHELLDNDREKRVELLLEDGEGRIISYHPFKSMQIIFYDIYSPERLICGSSAFAAETAGVTCAR